MKYFKLSEFSKSETATAKGIDNTIPKSAEYNIIKLVDAILDPLREAYGKPIIISSGYRCSKLNKEVGGSTTSQHLTGKAADLQIRYKDGKVNTVETRKLYDIIVNNKLPFDQVILEKGTQQNPIWVHVSYDETRNRREKLYYNGNTKKYIKL